jgi:hypothetical protein
MPRTAKTLRDARLQNNHVDVSAIAYDREKDWKLGMARVRDTSAKAWKTLPREIA